MKNLLSKQVVGTCLGAILSTVLFSQAIAQPEPSPTPSPTPKPLFTYAGDLRSFYFGRTNGNTCFTCKTKGAPDATAFNTGALLHGQLNIPRSPFSLNATYFGAFPFGANAVGKLGNVGYNPQVDNTLPGYALSLWGEEYVQYKTTGTLFQSGREVINTPWANAADSRLAPQSFQGTLISGNLTPDLSVGAMYMARFRSRVTSAFNSNTFLTSCNTAYPTGKGEIEGVSGTFTVPGDPCNEQRTTSGFSEFNVAYTVGLSGVTVAANQYEIYDIASMTWVSGQYAFARSSSLKPYVAGQYLAESNLGSSDVGTVHAHMPGGQMGATVAPNLNFIFSYNGSPATADVVSSKACKGSASEPTGAKPNVVFGGVAVNDPAAPAGDVLCYGGGIASPYTDGEATDPLYTSSLTQGLADVHKPGTGVKAALAYQSNNGRLRTSLSRAWYDYSLPGSNGGVSNADYRGELDFDVQYFLNPVHPGHPYKGLSIRQRYGERTQTFSPYDFKYSRTQLEYTF